MSSQGQTQFLAENRYVDSEMEVLNISESETSLQEQICLQCFRGKDIL